MASENNINLDAATTIVSWLSAEGAIDYDGLKEIYLTDEEGVRE